MANADHPVLVVGGDSLIGNALLETYDAEGEACLATSRNGRHDLGLDLAAAPDTWELPKSCSAAFLCAGRTKLAQCEAEPEESSLINVSRTIEVARKLRKRGAFVVFLSTNLVFDGKTPFPTVQDTPKPTTAYGRQKAAAEKLLCEFGDRFAIVRMTKVVHSGMPLLQEWAAALRQGQVIKPYSDMVFSPLPLTFVANALQSIASRRQEGIIHLSAETDISYAMFACSLVDHLEISPDLIKEVPSPVTPSRFGTLMMQPRDLELMAPPPAQETIRELLSSLA